MNTWDHLTRQAHQLLTNPRRGQLTPAVTAELAYVLADTDDDVAELVDRIWSLPTYTDNMGHRTVIYWPNIKAPNTAGED